MPGLPLLKQCRDSEKSPTTPRAVFISDYRVAYDQLVATSHTDEFRQEMKLRPQIERIIAGRRRRPLRRRWESPAPAWTLPMG